MITQIAKTMTLLVKTKPLVLNLTNYVTMDFMANSLLAIGAAPIMSRNEDELEELIKISSSININIGTLSSSSIKRCFKAVTLAKKYKKAIVLDPVGSGASFIRTKTAQSLMKHADIVRGNASEIISLQEHTGKTLGVESTHTTKEAIATARELSRKHGFVAVVSGPVDFITDGKREAELPFGSSLMPAVTGMGCALTAVIAAFRGVEADSFESAKLATAYFGLCGQLADKKLVGPGTFRTNFIDTLYAADFEKMRKIYVKSDLGKMHK